MVAMTPGLIQRASDWHGGDDTPMQTGKSKRSADRASLLPRCGIMQMLPLEFAQSTGTAVTAAGSYQNPPLVSSVDAEKWGRKSENLGSGQPTSNAQADWHIRGHARRLLST